MEDWKKYNKEYSDKLWPGWDKNLSQADKDTYDIDGILSYYEATIQPVIDELGPDPSEEKWHEWLFKWSKLSVEDFLRGLGGDEMKSYPLTPWAEPAIEGYKVSTYTPMFGEDLATYLREDLGKWWADPLKTPKLGMDTLPKAFTKRNKNGWNPDVDLSKNIKFGIMVTKVENTEKYVKGKKVKKVIVTGNNASTGHVESVEGDAVILTLPLQILRQIDIPFSIEKQKALSQISYGASTKVMLQCKTRFWQKDVGHGGFSKTNMMIGQLHYPYYEESGIGDDERGVLMVYTWQENALTYGSQPKDIAIRSAVHDISKIHSQIKDQFEVGVVQAWSSDPTSEGAFALLKPFEYIDHMKILTKPTETIYLAGEALSWSSGWIQGAIFSGLMQAYCFQSHLEDKEVRTPVSLMLGKK
ncbi:L-amino acid oxidase-like [Mercenaria mercenaria]|uniref:L-amino acid oxidase-like n=1 Tax=Mercenaria mercenaria TaxID=6596 RepID=UPI00234EDA94|nr:L-amino acid oxidase-like [Mercenaria mercenaria]XP_053396838.1 L-amino acid oxidase-like [Mercenaria mercenaria]